jgi:catechol 2,3-dioxygenase-like lactoylglutathione lyase family enzyme
MASLGYACIGTNDFDGALRFYDALFAEMGGRRLMTTPAGEIYALESGAAVGIVRPFDGQPAHPGNGTMLAFRVSSHPEVARLHALAMALGASDEGAAGPRADFGTFAYVRDPDGNKLAFYCRERNS